MTGSNRRVFLQEALAFGATATTGISLSENAIGMKTAKGQLEVAAIRFGTMAEIGDATSGKTGSKVEEVAGPLKTTIMLFRDADLRICIIASDFGHIKSDMRDIVAEQLDLDRNHVMGFASHNHSIANMTASVSYDYKKNTEASEGARSIRFTRLGEKLANQLRESARRLPDMLVPVSVWYAEGTEGRITYNRKGRHADGSTYFMREEDRQLVGEDFNGDIDRQAPVIVFKNASGRAVAGLVQFTGHPVTSYQPEKPVVFGDWPQTATDIVARELADGGEPIPVGFLQGCCGDVSSKEMFTGGVGRARQFGQMLGESFVNALPKLKPSARQGMVFAAEAVPVPLDDLPTEETLRAEIVEMRDFILRAKSGDEGTLACVGLNFPRALSPEYRAALIEAVLPWNEWALDLRRTGREDTVIKTFDLPINVIRLGDVGIIGMQCEPFQGIGRRLRLLSHLPLTVPCGYTNGSHGYITDSGNTGDREYMSAFYRYTKFRPPFRKPAGDVVADRAAEILAQFEPATRQR